jgi:transposase
VLYFGIDWSEEYHQLCICNESGVRVSQLRFTHSLQGFQQMQAERLKLGTPTSDCLVAIETAHNLLVDFLLDHDYTVYIVPPQATDGYRARHCRSGAHTDESDAALLADILRTDRAQQRRLRPNLALTEHLLAEVRLIETLRRAIQRQGNQLRSVLLRVYPTALGLFCDLTNQISLHFLSAYPTAQQAQALSLADFTAFCQAHGYKRSDLITRRYAHLLEPVPAARPSVVEAYQDQVRVLAQLLLPQVRARNEALSKLGQLLAQHPDAPIFQSLPGAGELLAPALLVKFGDHRERFVTADEVQAQAGTCPVTEQSGKKRVVRFRQQCDKEFRRIVQQFARASVEKCGWAAAYWRDLRVRTRSDSHAYRALADRWLGIIWKLWQTRQLYDEAYHLQQRARRRAPKGWVR